jgi:hypothetical protein
LCPQIVALLNHKEDLPFWFDVLMCYKRELVQLIFILTSHPTEKISCTNNRYTVTKRNDNTWVWLMLCDSPDAYSYCLLPILPLPIRVHMYAWLSTLVSLLFVIVRQ